MITLSYLHAILYLVVTFGLLCGLLSLRLENQRKARFIRTFENLLMRALRSRYGAEINLNGHAWRVTLAPVKREDGETAGEPETEILGQS